MEVFSRETQVEFKSWYQLANPILSLNQVLEKQVNYKNGIGIICIIKYVYNENVEYWVYHMGA